MVRGTSRLSFNPPPAVGPGETCTAPGHDPARAVSIRPRRWGRGKPTPKRTGDTISNVSIRPRRWGRGKRVGGAAAGSASLFQSAPGGGAGGNVVPVRPPRLARRFQSAPGGGAGGNQRFSSCSALSTISFNPPPAVGPGETLQHGRREQDAGVSIRPRRWGRGKPARTPWEATV